MAGIKKCCVFPAFVALSLATEVQAASLYTTRCDDLTGTAVSDPATLVPDVQIVQRSGTPPSQDTRRREHVQISAGLATLLGIDAEDAAVTGEAPQIRVSRLSGDPTLTANFTVATIDPGDLALRLAVWLPEDLKASGSFSDQDNGFFKLFGTSKPSTVFQTLQRVNVHDMAPSTTVVVEDGVATRRVHFAEPNASSSKRFIECLELRDDDRLAVLNPHGGSVEVRLSDELDTLLSDLEDLGYEPSVWEGAGQWGGGTTFVRFHATATQISGESFPGYGALEASGTYQYGLSLHGFSRSERAVVMGGRASRQAKCFLLERIEDWLDEEDLDRRITYKVYGPDGPEVDVVRKSTGKGDKPKPLTGVDDLSGTSPDNIVNRISPNAFGDLGFGGIQLELSHALRTDTPLFREFMRALASALDELIALDPDDDYCEQYE